MAPRKTSGKRGSTQPADQKPQRRKRKNNGEIKGTPGLVPMPHGGALRTGGTPGNAGGTGRPRKVIRDGLLADFDARTKFYTQVIDGELIEHREVNLAGVLPHVKCSVEGCSGKIIPRDPADLFIIKFSAKASASVKDRLAALDSQAKYSLGALKGVLQDAVEENVRKTLAVLKSRLSAEQYDTVARELRPIWS